MAQKPQAAYSRSEWNEEYASGIHRKKWDLDWPTPDLVAAVATLGLTKGLAVDLGCGTGTEAAYLASRGLTVLGIDLSHAALSCAHARHRATIARRLLFCEADVLCLPVADATADLVCDRGCLHSLGLPQWRRYADELSRVLRPGGLALLRGCNDPTKLAFTALSSDRVIDYFGGDRFTIRAMESISLCASSGHIPAAFVLLQRH